MEKTLQWRWHPSLHDPTGQRSEKPRTCGKTMVMDKGLGKHAFNDLLETSAPYIDMIKIGFGTSVLYPDNLLKYKIEQAKANQITIYPGGTFLEIAIAKNLVKEYFDTVRELGFSAVEISDGTISVDRNKRSHLIAQAIEADFAVYTEYGKKYNGSTIKLADLIQTVITDIQLGAEMVTIEGRESGTNVGIYDHKGECKDHEIISILEYLPNHQLLWEAPQKSQQVHFIQLLGSDVNFGNIAADDVISLEALRRGLRSDTFVFPKDDEN